jgi:hypothetical protein
MLDLNYNVGDSRGFQELRGRFSNYAHCTEKYRLVNLILNYQSHSKVPNLRER